MDETTGLRKCLLFRELTNEEFVIIDRIVSSETESYMPGALICQKDSPGESLFMVKSGKVQISLPGDLTNIILAELGPGKFFGEMSLLDKSPRSANVIALEQTDIYVLTRNHIAYLIEKESAIAAKMMLALSRVLSARIRILNKRIEDILSAE